jgi:predicted XRE-type DNA-binding protein
MEKAEYLRQKLRKAIVAKIKREGWSQSEAGKLCGTSRVHMNHLVNGKGWAALPKMIQVADGLGLRVDLIIEDTSRKEK